MGLGSETDESLKLKSAALGFTAESVSDGILKLNDAAALFIAAGVLKLNGAAALLTAVGVLKLNEVAALFEVAEISGISIISTTFSSESPEPIGSIKTFKKNI